MGVLSLSNETVWQANSACIRQLIAAIEADPESAEWQENAAQQFETFKHYDMHDAPSKVLTQVKQAAKTIASHDESPLRKQVFLKLIELISTQEAPNAP